MMALPSTPDKAGEPRNTMILTWLESIRYRMAYCERESRRGDIPELRDWFEGRASAYKNIIEEITGLLEGHDPTKRAVRRPAHEEKED